MKLKKFDRLPVVDKGKELVGIVTIKDILNFNPEYYPELEEFAEIREEQEKLNRIKRKEVAVTEDGICEECGGRDILYRFNGMLICGSCKNSM
jgi:CBS-domain-containing membrane protein